MGHKSKWANEGQFRVDLAQFLAQLFNLASFSRYRDDLPPYGRHEVPLKRFFKCLGQNGNGMFLCPFGRRMRKVGLSNPEMVSGTYVFVEGEVSDTIRLYPDATYEQELKIGDAVYTAKAPYRLNEGGAVIFRHLYTRFTDDGVPLNPPQKESVVSTHWYSDGTIKFVLNNPDFNDGAGPGFIASDKYYVKRAGKK